MPLTNTHLITSLPYEITESGRYQISGSLAHSGGDFSLRISAPAVTLDLAGYTITSSAEVAILLNAAEFSLCNGKVNAMKTAVAPEPHLRADHCQFERLEVEGGLFVGGQALRARDCSIRGGTYGLKAGRQANIANCQVTDCHLGFEVEAGSELKECTVTGCEDGVYAFGTREEPCHLHKVLVYDCRGLGLRLDGPGVIERCEAHNNGQVEPAGGILAGPAAVVRDCEAYGNQGGDISIVEPCELSGNRTSDGSGQSF